MEIKTKNGQHNWSEITSLLESIQDPAVLIGLDYKILAANRAYELNYETTSHKAQKKFCYEISHRYTRPCDEAGETCPLKQSLSTQQPHRVLHLHHTPRGQEHVDVEMHPIHNKDGKVLYFLETMRTSKVASSTAEGDGLIGRSTSFNQMLELIERVAPTEANVLLLGESGTGKELVSQAIHKVSKHALGPFVPLECSGLTESLFESELFGHEKGAFTGASNRKIGLVEVAQGGTLFLDEIGDVPLAMQVKLLRLIESQTYRRVGSTEPQKADFRLICATHHNLEQLIEEGKFRQDLFYRISVFPMHLPALRERKGDIQLLAQHLLKKIDPTRHIQLDKKALSCLENYEFPGNIRELRNILERACILIDGNTILVRHLPDSCSQTEFFQQTSIAFSGEIKSLAEIEKDYLKWAVAQFNDDKKALSEKLGLGERTLYRKLKEL